MEIEKSWKENIIYQIYTNINIELYLVLLLYLQLLALLSSAAVVQ